MKDYMIEPSIINLIAKIYSNDSTTVTLGEIEEEMDINSGIKQGCTASTTLFNTGWSKSKFLSLKLYRICKN